MLPPAHEPRRDFGGGSLLCVSGFVLTAGVWLTTAARTGVGQVPVMRWVIVGVGVEVLALLVAGTGIVLGTKRIAARAT